MNPLILALLHVLEVLEGLDGENVLLALLRHLLRAGLYQILEQQERFVDVSPVLAVVVCSLPDHLHDLGKRDDVVGEVGDLRHDGRRRSPWIVRRRLAYFHLNVQGLISCRAISIISYSPEHLSSYAQGS